MKTEYNNVYNDIKKYINNMILILLIIIKYQSNQGICIIKIDNILTYITNIFDFTYDDFTLEGYDPHPAIKGSVAV